MPLIGHIKTEVKGVCAMARENSLKLKLSFGGWSISIDPMNAFKTATALFLTDAGFAKTADFQWRHQPPHCTFF